MQETEQKSQYQQRESSVFLHPVRVEEFFTEENFLEARNWNGSRLLVESARLNDTVTTYSSKFREIPFPIAQMAVYVYKSVRMAGNGREVNHLELGLDDLTEHGLKNALDFCGQVINRRSGVDDLGRLTRIVSYRFKNFVFVTE